MLHAVKNKAMVIPGPNQEEVKNNRTDKQYLKLTIDKYVMIIFETFSIQ